MVKSKHAQRCRLIGSLGLGEDIRGDWSKRIYPKSKLSLLTCLRVKSMLNFRWYQYVRRTLLRVHTKMSRREQQPKLADMNRIKTNCRRFQN